MINVKMGNVTSSNFAIGENNEVTVNSNNQMLNQSDINTIIEELENAKKNLNENTTIYSKIDDVIEAANDGEQSLIDKIKKHASIFTSSIIIDLISSGVYDLIKNIINSK